MAEHEARRVGLFVTCLVDLIRPTVGFAAVKLLEDARCIVDVPRQTCCGQPAFNSGDRTTTREIADAGDRGVRAVRLRGGAVRLLRRHAEGALSGAVPRRSQLAAARRRLRRQDLRAGRASWSTCAACSRVAAQLAATATYHDSCSGLRELGVHDQPRALLRTVEGLRLAEMRDADVCCGFGGTFCVKYPDISNAIVGKKAANIAATGAGLLLAGDLGCLMNMAGKLQREGSDDRSAPRRRSARRHDAGAGDRSCRHGRRRRAGCSRRAPGREPSPGAKPREPRDDAALPSRDLAALQGQRQGGARRPRPAERAEIRRGQFHRAAARGGRPPARVRGAARFRARHQGPHARPSRSLSRSLRGAPHRAGRPSALCGDRARTPGRSCSTSAAISAPRP